MDKLTRIMEKVWLVVAISASLITIYFLITEGVGKLSYLIFPGIAWVWYVLRRWMRLRMEKHMNQQ